MNKRAANHRSSVRRLTGLLHAWLGALSSVLILLVALSGMVIAFSSPLLNLETGAFPSAGARDPGMSADLKSLVQDATNIAGGRFMPLGYLGPNAEIPTSVEMIYGMSDLPDEGGEVQIVTFDPASSESYGAFFLDRTLVHRLIEFHYGLLAGEVGEKVVAAAGLLMVSLAIAGLYLWWPRNMSVWRKLRTVPALSPLARQSLSVHGFIGTASSVFVIAWGLTGVYWSQPDWAPDFIVPATESLTSQNIARLSDASCSSDVSVGDAVQAALETHPGTSLWEAEFAAPWQAYHTIHLSTGSDLDRKDGDVRVWVSAVCDNVIVSQRVGQSGVVGALSPSIHSGELFGALRIPIVMAVGSATSLLTLLGMIAWWKRYVRGN